MGRGELILRQAQDDSGEWLVYSWKLEVGRGESAVVNVQFAVYGLQCSVFSLRFDLA